jgi:crotonobetainyl-CoA:carnitine CoA-transferase CaiB-like acyl-CoA transferase
LYPQKATNVNGVLDDIRVLDLSQAMAGPYCAMLLGDLGADVIKIEKPGAGDQSRGWGPPFIQSESAYYLSANRNKRSLTLNLDRDEGVDLLHRLVRPPPRAAGRGADVFVINQPSRDSLAKRRIDYDTLRTLNPRLVYCSVTGYGFTGPKAGRAGYDLIAQGEAGLMSFTGEAGAEPIRYPVPIADITTGIYAALGVLAALRARDKSGEGQFVDMALFDSQLTWLNHIGSNYLNAGEEPQRIGNAHASIVPYQVFRAQDKYIIVGVGSEGLWKRFCQVLNISETIERDDRFLNNRLRSQHRGELIPLLQEIIETRPALEWLCALQAAEIPCGPINSAAEALGDPQARERGMIVEIEHPLIGVARSIGNPIRLSATAVTYRRHPPRLGEHSEEVLRELGQSEEQIEGLRAQGVI